MKKLTIKNASVRIKHISQSDEYELIIEGEDDLQVSDGYHTMDELYDHRIALFIALCKDLDGNRHPDIWRSKKHSDGTFHEGWFILGINCEAGKQITYHIPMREWKNTDFARMREFAPEWDGHTSADVLERLKNI